MTTSSAATAQSASADAATLDAVGRQLKLAAVVACGFGALFSFGSHATTDWPVRFMGDVLFLRPGDRTAELTDINHLADAILGGLMIGWMVAIWLLADRLLHRAPADVKFVITVSVVTWFVVDGVGSVASGAWVNVISNAVFLALFLVPLRRITT